MNSYKKDNIKKPNRVIYFIAFIILSLFFKAKYKLKIDKEQIKNIKSPFIVLSNHICNIDFLVVGLAMYPYKLNYVAGAIYFRMKFVSWLIRIMGCIPKEQFVRDPGIVRHVYEVIKRGDNVIIFPSGQSSFSGESTYIDRSIAKLVKKMNVQIISSHMNGGHIAFPKWNMKSLRKSRIEIELKPMLSPDEMQNMSSDEIYKKIVDTLYFDDYEWQRKNMIKAKKPRNVEGLQQILFMCPKCESEFNMKTEGNRLFCTKCGNTALMDEYGFLHAENSDCKIFETPTEWNRWQFKEYENMVDDNFAYSEQASLFEIAPNGKKTKLGEGTVTITVDNIKYEGTYGNEEVTMSTKNDTASMFGHEAKTEFNVVFNNKMYAVAPKNGGATFKFVMLKEIIYKKYYADKEKNLK